MVLLYDPTAASQAGAAGAARKLDSLAGKTVGFIDNAKPNFNHLVDDLAELLVAQYGVKQVIKRRKHSASVPAPEEVVRELSDQCDVVIAGSGDWGSCASWSVHDSVEIAKRGRAAVTVCSTAFLTLGRAQAKALGNPALPIAVIAHPFGLRKRDEVREMARECVSDIVKLVTAGGGNE